MEQEQKIIKIMMYILENLKIIKKLVKVSIFIQMVIFMKVILKMLLLRGKVQLNFEMEKYMKETSKKGKQKEKVN